MTWWHALVLGVVQGFTEFFPVSSSGHLVMAEELLGLHLPGVGFDVALHIATLLSVLIVYRRRIADIALGLVGRGRSGAVRYLLALVVASVPAAIAGIGFMDFFEARFDDPLFTGTMILVTGSFVWSSRWASEGKSRRLLEYAPIAIAAVVAALAGTIVPFVAVLAIEAVIMAVSRLTAPGERVKEPGWWDAVAMGIAQAVAILPGVSRSGSTVLTGLWRRVEPAAAAEFSFLMSVPAIVGAAILSLPELNQPGQAAVGAVPLLVGGIAAAVCGVLAIRYFVLLLRHQNFHVFAYYCWVVGALFVLTR